MPLKAAVFCTEKTLKGFKAHYDGGAQKNNFEVASYAVFRNNKINLVADSASKVKDEISKADFVILHSFRLYFHARFRFIEALGVPREKIIDGRAFQAPNLNFSRLLEEGVAYGLLQNPFDANSRMIHPQVYRTANRRVTFSLGKKSYIRDGSGFEGAGSISLGNFCSFAKYIFFSLGQNGTHNYRNVSTVSLLNSDWPFPKKFLPPQGNCKILVGNDVWCGRGSTFKSTNPNRPLIIGDGSIIASDSVVVKNVPPYAIVGGNPAQIIKYRFPPQVIEALLRIKWWDWDIEKIHDNFKYFNDIKKFIALHDK